MSADRIASQATMLANRLAKNAARLRSWLGREQVSCYRLFDRDIPEIPLAIDVLGPSVVISDSRLRDQGTPEFEAWMDAMREVVLAATDVEPSAIFIKQRRPMKDRRAAGAQYEKNDGAQMWQRAREGGHEFWLNLTNYLDTGLFLDHRITRGLVAEEAKGKSLLNLFCYTGSFSVYAGCRGAARTYSVDMSNTYLEWAERNFRQNNMSPASHRILRADVLAWLETAPSELFDVAIVDPPTFSNSKKMTQEFDVLRDHPLLVRNVFRRMRPGGVVWFSTNHRSFRLDSALRDEFAIVDMTKTTTPPDFSHSRPHQSFRIVRR